MQLKLQTSELLPFFKHMCSVYSVLFGESLDVAQSGVELFYKNRKLTNCYPLCFYKGAQWVLYSLVRAGILFKVGWNNTVETANQKTTVVF